MIQRCGIRFLQEDSRHEKSVCPLGFMNEITAGGADSRCKKGQFSAAGICLDAQHVVVNGRLGGADCGGFLQ